MDDTTVLIGAGLFLASLMFLLILFAFALGRAAARGDRLEQLALERERAREDESVAELEERVEVPGGWSPEARSDLRRMADGGRRS